MLDPLLDPWLDPMLVHAFPLYILLYYYYRQTWPCTTYHYNEAIHLTPEHGA